MHLLTWEVLDGDKIKPRLERDANISNYAILSHRWGNPQDEVSYEDMLAGLEEGKKGYTKLVECCKQAQRDGFQYIWNDTCCINKASSAELSETVASMFTYYQRSRVCYAYLDDVFVNSIIDEDFRLSFSQSVWFTRGWTLQELIAPSRVKFFNASWNFLGEKTDACLTEIIESVTRIDSIVLNVPATIRLMSTAKKMSWAARRRTTRLEDRAYSLMGIFGVYMPPLYGEGNHAFMRLQEQIMRTTHDHTIFAWTSPPTAALSQGLENVSTMLALSPDQFEESSNFRPLPHNDKGKIQGRKLDYALTNAGLAIQLPIARIEELDGIYAAFLSCSEVDNGIPAAILLRNTSQTPAGHYWRTNFDEGPIERSGRQWFSTREVVNAEDIYVLPRFTSISGDNVEPGWTGLKDVNTRYREEDGAEAKRPTLTLNREMLLAFNHVPDPSHQELVFLNRAQQMIVANQAERIIDRVMSGRRTIRTIPVPRNKQFFGHRRALKTLSYTFLPSNPDSNICRGGIQCCIVSGIAEIGKTELAVEFSYRCIDNGHIHTVLWVNAETERNVVDGFRRIALDIGLSDRNSKLPPDVIVHKVLQWLSRVETRTTRSRTLDSNNTPARRWLLVFDGVLDVSFLQKFWPHGGSGGVLVTTRDYRAQIGVNSKKLILEPFTTQQTSEFLRTLTKIDTDFTAVSEGTGGMPTAIRDAAAYLVTYGVSVEQFVRKSPSISERVSSARSNLSPTAFRLLRALSLIDEGTIPDSVMAASLEVSSGGFPCDEVGFIECRSELLKTTLVHRFSEHLELTYSRPIQHEVRTRYISNRDFDQTFGFAVDILYSAWVNTSSDREARNELLSRAHRLTHHLSTVSASQDGLHAKAQWSKLMEHVRK
ncbi:hypothetical protein F4677DRAFT_416919 [Hypoxylon crocopeplum]|nr:hypothetical protein F4677DRAFT_416919 [Hypoxylon crocopeplum]